LDRAFRIVEEVVSHQENGLSFAEIVALTGSPKSSTHRILKNLVALDYLVFDAPTGKYRGSLKLSSLGSEVLARFDLRNHVRPHLMDLHRETQHTCNLAVRVGGVGVYLDRIESPNYGIRLFSELGQSFPLHSSGLGKALVAFVDPNLWDEILRPPLKAYTPRTITDLGKLKEQLRRFRDQGYTVEREETIRGIMCFGAPVMGPGEEVLGAISLPFPSYLEAERDLEADIEAVKRHAAAASISPGQGGGA